MKKKIVYVVLGGWDWEGNEIISIHRNPETAALVRDKALKEGHPNRYDSVHVEEYEVQP